ncbi:SMC-Scp complex subunit ScpB [Thermanaeromonas sp.]|uniref:SMC-Scp complex subunit ScpB n=1 Tax=Thermanaeromonas sp. TaxID=2003697 RepID=UPI002619E7D2|nr:SMC-Scp complex subunit ScpB [Thermanaeromonas sp.]
MATAFSRKSRAALECLLFVSSRPASPAELARALKISEEEVEILVQELQELYERDEHGLQIRKVAGGYQMCTRPEYASYIENFLKPELPSLSRAALETLAIIAYRQPITKAEIENLRGVKVDGVLATLLNRGLVKEVGRKDAPGRPILYGTTSLFLEHFGLKSLEELPPLEEVAPAREQ